MEAVGRLQQHSWTAEDGSARSAVEVTADELHHQVVGFAKQPHAAGLGLCARREGFEPNRQIRRLVLASIWSTPDGSGLLKLGASSIQTD